MTHEHTHQSPEARPSALAQSIIRAERRRRTLRRLCTTAVIAGAAVAALWLFAPFQAQGDCCGGGSPDSARAGQITTMVARFNQFRPDGAAPIELVEGATYTPQDLSPLVNAGYCADADLVNHTGTGWRWNSTTRKFEPTQP
ncbi:MAG: hypothetical protein JNK53_02185 [Phycisphaerae bacterium]|nr:hypothetical protein [Phycisphaerae bacterium]